MKTIVLPGLDGTGLLLADFLAAAPRSFDASVLPLPERCISSLDELANYVVERLADEDDVLLIAESFSGPLAVRLASEHQERVRGLVLVATFVDSPIPRALRWLPWRTACRLPPPAFLARWMLLGAGAPRALLESFRLATAQVPSDVLASLLALLACVDERERLAKLSCPTLYLRAGNDRLLSPRHGRVIVATKPDTRLVELVGPHLLLQRRPEEAWKHIALFCGQWDGAAELGRSARTAAKKPG